MSEPRVELAGRIMGFMLSQAVYVAAKLAIADLVADGPRPADDLAERASAHPDALYRLLRVLSGYGIFVEQPGRAFANSELSELLRDVPGSSRDFALIFGEEFYPALGGLLEGVRTGEPSFDATFGAQWDEFLAREPEKSARFNRFMAGGKEDIADALAAAGWRGAELVVDVGGGIGALLRELLERLPGTRGIVFDLPHVVPEGEEALRAAGLEERCRVVAGNYFDGVPDGGDVYVLSHILHGWDGDRATEIVRSVRRAIRGDGRLLIVDGVLGPPNEPGQKLMDLLMLSVGGRERTEDEWRSLLTSGGFELHAIRPASYGHVIEARPV